MPACCWVSIIKVKVELKESKGGFKKTEKNRIFLIGWVMGGVVKLLTKKIFKIASDSLKII